MTKSRETKFLQGTLRRCRDNPNAPKLPAVKLSVGSIKLVQGEADTLQMLADGLNALNVVTAADMVALEGLAGALADLHAARASLAQPMTIEHDGACQTVAKAGERYYWTSGSDGPMRRPRPELRDISNAEKRFAAWAARFGMTPVDRQRVAAVPEEAENAFEGF